MKTRLYDEYIRRLLEVNDESKTDEEHRLIESRFRGWIEGVEDAAGHRFNGDYYYIELFDSGKMQERPLCCGVFLDWKSNASVSISGDEPEYAPRACWVCVCGTKVFGGITGICSKCGADWWYQPSKPNT